MEVVKAKQRRPLRSERFRIHADPGDNAKYIHHTMELMQFGKVDMDTPDLVKQRVIDYFSLCERNDMKPSIEGLSLAFGSDRKTMWNWAHGVMKHVPQETVNILNMAYTAVNSMLADYMQNGKINPIPAIFLMKNNMGYTDQTNIVVTPNNPLGSESSAEEVQKRITEGVIIDIPDEE